MNVHPEAKNVTAGQLDGHLFGDSLLLAMPVVDGVIGAVERSNVVDVYGLDSEGSARAWVGQAEEGLTVDSLANLATSWAWCRDMTGFSNQALSWAGMKPLLWTLDDRPIGTIGQ